MIVTQRPIGKARSCSASYPNSPPVLPCYQFGLLTRGDPYSNP